MFGLFITNRIQPQHPDTHLPIRISAVHLSATLCMRPQMGIYLVVLGQLARAEVQTDLPPNEHLRTRTQGRLRASTSGYGEVRVDVAFGC